MRFRLRKMDTASWLPLTDESGLKSATIRADANRNGSSPMLQSCIAEVCGQPEEGYYRIQADDGAGGLSDLGTFLMTPDESDWSCGSWATSMTGRSVLAHAAEVRFAPGSYIPMGTECSKWAAKVLARDIPAPVEYRGDAKLAEHCVIDDGATHLDGIWQVLNLVGYAMSISAAGTVTIGPKDTQPVLVIDTEAASELGCDISRSVELEDVPNVVRVYVNGESYVAENDDPDSPASITRRGRRIEAVEIDPIEREGESPVRYAQRRLAELSEVTETHDVTRKYRANVGVNSVIRVNLPEQGMAGDVTILSQSMDCDGRMIVDERWGSSR